MDRNYFTVICLITWSMWQWRDKWIYWNRYKSNDNRRNIFRKWWSRRHGARWIWWNPSRFGRSWKSYLQCGGDGNNHRRAHGRHGGGRSHDCGRFWHCSLRGILWSYEWRPARRESQMGNSPGDCRCRRGTFRTRRRGNLGSQPHGRHGRRNGYDWRC